ncbi:hypothetical protein [Devosia sp. SL43]|uniref:hypothetical protein n=1 Tax=Devosia sp. SL43 TaxID=2806348 RepID=UPI001F36F106|nr:hypothetical protein [Devosia sp. SL43]UJW85391.1 hypothetical protein IM737_18655 [Devosia sp. SL43]
MKLHTLFLSTALLSTPAYAADLGVLTSLDICDELGLSGLTLSSDTNCLQVTGSVYYEFYWGDYGDTVDLAGANPLAYSGDFLAIDDNGAGEDWETYVETYLKFVGTAASDFGPAKAVVEIYGYEELGILNEAFDYGGGSVEFDYAYVSVGDTTVVSAGLQDSIANLDDDEAFGWIQSFLSDDVGDGVAFDNAAGGVYDTDDHSIQIVSDLGNGVKVGGALEALNTGADAGSAIGVISYGGETISAHFTAVAGEILDGSLDDFAIHTGVTATFDKFKARAALAANDTGWWNGIISGEAKFDMFALAAAVDANAEREWSAVGSATIDITEEIVLKGAVRYLDSDTAIADDEGLEVRLRAEYKATEALTLAFEGGNIWVGAGAVNGSQSIFDGLVEATWAPGGGFEATSAVAANSLGAYKVSFTASKDFE